MSKRASYRYGVEWIAGNDEPSDLNVGTVSEMVSVCLLADLFGKNTLEVAVDVVGARVKSRKSKTNSKEVNAEDTDRTDRVFTEDDIPF